MTIQKSFGDIEQMLFQNGGGKKKVKYLGKKKTKKRVKKGSENLMTFGMRLPGTKTIEDYLKIEVK